MRARVHWGQREIGRARDSGRIACSVWCGNGAIKHSTIRYRWNAKVSMCRPYSPATVDAMCYFKYKIIFLLCFEIRANTHTHKHNRMCSCSFSWNIHNSIVHQSDIFGTWTHSLSLSLSLWLKSHFSWRFRRREKKNHTLTYTLNTATDPLHLLLGSALFNGLMQFFFCLCGWLCVMGGFMISTQHPFSTNIPFNFPVLLSAELLWKHKVEPPPTNDVCVCVCVCNVYAFTNPYL